MKIHSPKTSSAHRMRAVYLHRLLVLKLPYNNMHVILINYRLLISVIAVIKNICPVIKIMWIQCTAVDRAESSNKIGVTSSYNLELREVSLWSAFLGGGLEKKIIIE